MMKHWRPKGWKTIPLWSRLCDGTPITSTHEAFEAGADAMLEGLKKYQVSTPDILYWWITIKGREERKKGYLIFISDEEDNCPKCGADKSVWKETLNEEHVCH